MYILLNPSIDPVLLKLCLVYFLTDPKLDSLENREGLGDMSLMSSATPVALPSFKLESIGEMLDYICLIAEGDSDS